MTIQPPLPQIVYVTFAGMIDQNALTRIYNSFAAATQRGVTEAHLLFQSTGGNVGDGIALFNYFRALSIDLHIYNGGMVASMAVIAYLGGAHRYTSTHASFAIHKTRFPTQAPTNAVGHRALATQAEAEDARTEAILKGLTTIPASAWTAHGLHDVMFTAQEAVQFGIAQTIREFHVPQGNQIFNI
jgi:ATP-dependent protease ClpP protease subunit